MFLHPSCHRLAKLTARLRLGKPKHSLNSVDAVIIELRPLWNEEHCLVTQLMIVFVMENKGDHKPGDKVRKRHFMFRFPRGYPVKVEK